MRSISLYVFRVCVQTLLSLGLSYGGCLSIVHMTMRSVKPSSLSVSAHTKPAGPASKLTKTDAHNIAKKKLKERWSYLGSAVRHKTIKRIYTHTHTH